MYTEIHQHWQKLEVMRICSEQHTRVRQSLSTAQRESVHVNSTSSAYMPGVLKPVRHEKIGMWTIRS